MTVDNPDISIDLKTVAGSVADSIKHLKVGSTHAIVRDVFSRYDKAKIADEVKLSDAIENTRAVTNGIVSNAISRVREAYPERKFSTTSAEFFSRDGKLWVACICTRLPDHKNV